MALSFHIDAHEGDIAKTVLISGDPLRAKYMAYKFLKDVHCYTEVRGMYGYTGFYNDKRISIQGTGMGLPSTAIYVNELLKDYKVETILRVGSCGAFQKDLNLRDIILAMSASTDSQMNKVTFSGMDYAATADFTLLHKAYSNALEKNIAVRVGPILSTDFFYHDNPDNWKMWACYGVLAVEMESSCIYSLAAKYGVKSLTLLTVSDSLVNKTSLTHLDRESSFDEMMDLALSVVD